MKTLWKRALSGALAVAVMATAAPGVLAYAAEAQTRENADNLELSDGYLSVSMSTENGGFLVNTEEGDKLNKSDNNKNLLYPAADYDTSYTSVRVTRTDGSTEDYVFGRDYGFFGLDSSDVEVSKEGNTLKAQWSVKDLTMVQTLSLLDQNSAQHGMVSISYQVSTDRDDVENVKLRLMLDTALGYQDWATYELPGVNGIYQHITSEQVLDNRDGQAYSGAMFAVDDANAPSMTAYTVNASLDGQTVEPYQLAFGHWNNLAETSFDFTPDLGLDFTNPYNETYLTADSAYALYYDLGQITPDDSAVMSTYYGVYSNVTVGEEERAAINFPELPASMTFNEEQDAYLSQVEGGAEGDVHLQVSVSNISDDAVSQMAVVTRVRNGVQPYEDYYEGLLYEGGAREDFYQVVRDFQPGEEAQVEFYYNVSPLPVSEYRKFEILCYDISDTGELLEQNLLASREFYVLCPGVLGEILTFHSLNPQIIYTDGTRHLFLSGQNFQLLQNTSAYTVYLKSLSGGTDLVLDSSKVFLDMDKNSLDLVVDQHLDPGGYQVVFNWAEAGKEPTTSSALQFSVTEEPEYISDVYGVVTIEKDGEDGYALRLYDDETSYDRSLTDMEKQNQVLLEFRGDFTAQYDEDGNLVSASAVSVEAADGTVSSTINISNCLDVEAGSLTIRVENPGTEEQVINTDIDGKVYTTNSRTKVWNGVCAITSLENGEEYPLLQYDYMGNPTSDVENSVANTNAITLVWPGAASTAQTLAGILFEFRYCQFGLMALETGTVTDQTPKKRVVAFGAEMSPDFLLPSNFDWGNRQTSTLEAVQLNLAKSNYTADQLRDVQARYAADQQAWEEAETGSLSLYVHDILFGGGFVGFNASVEVALPSYADGLPGVEGTLNLRVMPDRDLWEVGVYGSADFAILNMEAELVITAYNNIPLPNKIYFYVGGFTPGINVDGMGIFWIQGAGGGVEGLADTVFLSSRVPPLKLIFSGQFALFAVLQARADLTMGMREFSLGMRDLNIAGITLLESASLTTQWYPELRLNAGIELNILDIIEGSGSIVLEEDKRENRLFWEGFATAGVTTPKIPLIGEIHIGDVDLGLNASKIWGALHVLMLDMGVTYYWGGDVDFAFGKYNTPEATVPAALSGIPVYTDAGTGRVLYMSVGTNARLEAATDRRTFDLAGTATRTNGESSIDRSADGMTHVIQLGSYSGASGKALTLSFQADSLEQAQRIAMGDSRYGTPGITLADPDDPGQTYSLRWLDTTQDAEEQSDANALLSYDQESGEANVTISFTQAEDYHAWRLTLGASAQSALYDIAYLPGLDSASVQWNDQTQELTVTWQGSELNDVENVAVYAVSQTEEGESTTTLLYETDDTGIISGGVAGATQGSATFAVPTDLPSGSYTIQVVGSSETRSVNDVVKVEEPLAYTNPNQPQAPVIDSVKLGGDYSIDVAVEKQGAYDGYVATIYEQTDTGLVATDLAQQWVETSGEAPEETLTLGGRYTTSAYVDGDGNAVLPSEAEGRDDVTSVEQTVGVEAGKVYKIGLAGYTTGPNGEIFLSQETLSSAITMQAPQKATVTVQAEGSFSVDGTDTINGVNATIQITSDMPVSGTWTLDGDVASGQWQAGTDQNFLDQAIDFFANLFGGEREQIGTIYLSGRAETDVLPDDGGLTEGTHILSLVGENEQGDAVSVKYMFRVDTTAPRLQLISPADGDYFSDTVTVEGLSEPGAVVTVLVDGQAAQTVTIPEDGTLSVEIPVDNTVLEHELTIYAEDAVGNVGRKMSIPLLNDIAAAPDVALGILFNGQDYTQQNIPAGTNGVVQLCLVSGSRRVPVPADSVMGRQAEWQTTVVKGTASLDNGLSLLTSLDVNGMLTVSLDQMQAAAVLGGNANDIDYQTCNVTVTANEGGTVSPAGTTAVTEGESFTLTITPDAYYHVESVVVN
ncbi:Ig-like domain-containing protein, partial [Pseudoflavonifractor sp. An176]|uniref:Ig-like domain-containing protein n=1 Tax=Pseudoflavonifractor sp. An176 TaxID=1965572 RepID=UPI00117B2786